MKHLNPVTPSCRFTVFVPRDGLWAGKPEKSLCVGKIATGGRNCQGRITVRHRGGGHKRLYRAISFRRDASNPSLCNGVVERLERDPNRSAFIALIRSVVDPALLFYIIAPAGLAVGDVVRAGHGAGVMDCASSLPLKLIPVGSSVHNVEVRPGKGGQMVRSAGTSARVMARDSGRVLLKLPSGRIVSVLSECFASLGIVSNADHKNVSIGKAGRNRWRGIRPSVRGVAMNPVDHPHGGGEGKTSGGRHPVTPQGFPTKGKKTVCRARWARKNRPLKYDF